jgi:hypothetical protein
MCDYSLTNVKSRPAQVSDRLVTKSFGTGTTGFACVNDLDTAVCVLPGTEIAFDLPFQTREWSGMFSHRTFGTVAIFRQINKESPCAHHDALETPQGEKVLLTGLREGQHAVVLQLPAAPKNEVEASEQERLAIVG